MQTADVHEEKSSLTAAKSYCKRRGGEIALALGFFVLGRMVSAVSPVHQQYLPAYSPHFDYPIRLDGVWCTRSDIQLCINNSAQETSCCQNIGASPGSTVTTIDLALITIFVPAALFAGLAILHGIGTIASKINQKTCL
jgi:hypothetical protein